MTIKDYNMKLHPLFELLLNPFAGAAGVSMLSIMFYIGIALCIMVIILERSFHD